MGLTPDLEVRNSQGGTDKILNADTGRVRGSGSMVYVFTLQDNPAVFTC